MQSENSLRHLAFFEALGKMEDNDPSWRLVSAGLVVMRLIDRWFIDGAETTRSDSWSVTAVAESIDAIPETTPVRRILAGIVDTMATSAHVDVRSLTPKLMAYGQTLEYDAKWALAADVYETIVAHTDPVEDADLVVSAYIQLAFCLRTLTDLDAAAAAYANASRVALASGDLIGVLRGRIGDAKIAVARGNMPQAETILEETIERASSHGLDEVRSRALHERAYVAGLRGQHERAVRYSYEALESTPNARERDRILANIATGFRYLGLLDAARDAYLVLATTAGEQYVRWMSELNLMELAAERGLELQFDKYRRDLEATDFNPLLRVTYLLHVGRGYHVLGRAETGIPYLERAVDVASEHGLNHLLFQAEAALTEARRRQVRPVQQVSYSVGSDVQEVVEAVEVMRATAGIA
jgi:tetratricopeptide (TPR) repeat protein